MIKFISHITDIHGIVQFNLGMTMSYTRSIFKRPVGIEEEEKMKLKEDFEDVKDLQDTLSNLKIVLSKEDCV